MSGLNTGRTARLILLRRRARILLEQLRRDMEVDLYEITRPMDHESKHEDGV